MTDVPVYMPPGVPVVQPPHLEGLSDLSLSTEILTGPPSLLSVQQAAHKRDQELLYPISQHLILVPPTLD
jgi:hypothetical protein